MAELIVKETKQGLMRLSDINSMNSAADKPNLIRLGDIVSSEKESLPELNEQGFITISDEQRKQWETLGPIGYFEQAIRQDKTEMIPFNPEGAVKSIKLLNAVNRIKKDNYANNPDQKNIDIESINNFIFKSEEERIRGFTVGGKITQGVAALPGFMIEFLATGGLAALGRKGVSKLIKPIVKTIVKKKTLKFATRVVGGVAGAVARTAAMPQRVTKGFADRQINASLEMTEDGLKIAEESREKPFTSTMKAFGDVVIENFSEVAGPTIGKIGKKFIPKRMADGLSKLFKRFHPDQNVSRLFTKAGYNGFLEEMGEERLGALLRAVTGVEDFGADDPDRMFDRVIASIPNSEELLVEAGVLAFPGLTNVAAQHTSKILSNRKVAQGVEPEISQDAKEIPISEETITEIVKAGEEKPEITPEIAPEEAKIAPEVAEGVEVVKPLTPTELARLDVLEAELGELEGEEREEQRQLEKRFAEAGVIGGEVAITKLQKAIQTARDKFVTEPAKTKAEIKETQNQLIKSLEATFLDAKDKAKFIKTIKNIQTAEQLNKALPEIQQRISRLVEVAEKRRAVVKINRELKATKPIKKGQRRVGKFDPESNKLFDSLRGFNKLAQENAQTEFDKFPEEGNTEFDLIKKRFLSLKANGAFASAEIHDQVLKDIQKIKKLGEGAKDEADLFNRINREDIVDNALSSIDKIKADKRTVKTKIGNAYRKGFSNIFSMLNSIGGKEFAEKHDPEVSENRRNTAVYKATLKVTVDASKIYNEKNIMRMFETMSQVDYEITDVKDGLTTELSKLELIDIFNSIKNEKKKQDYFEAFGKDQVENLMAKLTTEDESFADSLQEAVQSYREVLNKRNIEITGRDLGFVENYWPSTSEFEVSVIDDLRIQGETPSALKERAKARVIPVPRNAWYKAQRHIAQAEHVDNLSREFEGLKRLFNDRKVKSAIKKKFGDGVFNTLTAQIDNISLNKQTERIDAISGIFQRAINNWVTAKIALNPSTFVRQLMSVGNYAEKMNAGEWTVGFIKGLSSPVETFKFVWNNAPFLEARFNKGFSEALKEAIEGAESISVNKKNWTKALTSLVRAGDITAIVYGGAPLIRSELAKGKSMKEAIDTFEKATLKAQQSGLSSSVSQFQNSRNPFARLFLAFKNTSNQYFRKMVDAVISFQNGDISLPQFSKTMAIYAVIQPIMYVSAGFATKEGFALLGRVFGLRDDDEDFDEKLERFLDDIMIQLIVSPANAIPLLDDVTKTAARKLLGQKIFKVFNTPLLDDFENGFKKLTKENVTGGDYLKVSTSILEPATALPIATGIRFFEILTGQKIGKKKTKRRR